MATPDKGIPQDLIEKANCVVIVPGMKQAGFFVVQSTVKASRSAAKAVPVADGPRLNHSVEGGSFGFQIGASNTSVVMLVIERKGNAPSD